MLSLLHTDARVLAPLSFRACNTYVRSQVDVSSSAVGAGEGDGDQDEDDDIERGVLLRPYEHDKRMLARMRQAGGTPQVYAKCIHHALLASRQPAHLNMSTCESAVCV